MVLNIPHWAFKTKHRLDVNNCLVCVRLWLRSERHSSGESTGPSRHLNMELCNMWRYRHCWKIKKVAPTPWHLNLSQAAKYSRCAAIWALQQGWSSHIKLDLIADVTVFSYNLTCQGYIQTTLHLNHVAKSYLLFEYKLFFKICCCLKVCAHFVFYQTRSCSMIPSINPPTTAPRPPEERQHLVVNHFCT